MSPKVWRSKATKAVPASNAPACTQATQACGGRPLTLPITLLQLPPPSRVSCRLPSSVPTQIRPACLGDSLIE